VERVPEVKRVSPKALYSAEAVFAPLALVVTDELPR
jgi:hypothetical protein